MECKKPFIITAGSSPCFDTWGPADYWNCADWIAWHKALKSQYGQDEANRRFITEFHNAGFLSASYDCRTFNGSFRAYAKEENFYDGLYEGIAGLIVKPLGVGVAVTGAAADVVTGTLNFAKYIIPGLIILAFIILLIYFYNTFAINNTKKAKA